MNSFTRFRLPPSLSLCFSLSPYSGYWLKLIKYVVYDVPGPFTQQHSQLLQKVSMNYTNPTKFAGGLFISRCSLNNEEYYKRVSNPRISDYVL